jgi:hypothetical protein
MFQTTFFSRERHPTGHAPFHVIPKKEHKKFTSKKGDLCFPRDCRGRARGSRKVHAGEKKKKSSLINLIKLFCFHSFCFCCCCFYDDAVFVLLSIVLVIPLARLEPTRRAFGRKVLD